MGVATLLRVLKCAWVGRTLPQLVAGMVKGRRLPSSHICSESWGTEPVVSSDSVLLLELCIVTGV